VVVPVAPSFNGGGVTANGKIDELFVS